MKFENRLYEMISLCTLNLVTTYSCYVLVNKCISSIFIFILSTLIIPSPTAFIFFYQKAAAQTNLEKRAPTLSFPLNRKTVDIIGYSYRQQLVSLSKDIQK